MVKFSEASRRLRSTPAERAQWREKFLRSGLSRRKFARQHGLSLWTLHGWLRPARPNRPPLSATAPPFAELKLPAVSPAPGWVAEVLRPDGSTVRVAAEVSGRLLRQLLRVC